MKLVMFLMTLSLGLIVSAKQLPQLAQSNLPHWDLEMTSEEYQAAYARQPRLLSDSVTESLDQVLRLGERNLAWLKYMNQYKPAGQKISLIKKGQEVAFPIDQPRHYSEAIILKNYQNLVPQIPAALAGVLLQNQAFTQDPPIAIEDYLSWARKINTIYQSAARWRLMQPYLDQLKARRAFDVRGYYFLNKDPQTKQKLENWAGVSAAEKAQMRIWLKTLCYNQNGASQECDSELQSAESSNQLLKFYADNFPAGESLWSQFFGMPATRSDIVWNEASVMHLPFVDPKDDQIRHYLKDNIEDEWRLGDWHLQMDFVADDSTGAAHVEFQPGVTPHVNGIAGNTVTMDSNASLDDWDVQWTIRHEIGHVMGFVDCYVEFYESDQDYITNYQLDTTNLMCSRQGIFQQIHKDLLQKNYFKQVAR